MDERRRRGPAGVAPHRLDELLVGRGLTVGSDAEAGDTGEVVGPDDFVTFAGYAYGGQFAVGKLE